MPYQCRETLCSRVLKQTHAMYIFSVVSYINPDTISYWKVIIYGDVLYAFVNGGQGRSGDQATLAIPSGLFPNVSDSCFRILLNILYYANILKFFMHNLLFLQICNQFWWHNLSVLLRVLPNISKKVWTTKHNFKWDSDMRTNSK